MGEPKRWRVLAEPKKVSVQVETPHGGWNYLATFDARKEDAVERIVNGYMDLLSVHEALQVENDALSDALHATNKDACEAHADNATLREQAKELREALRGHVVLPSTTMERGYCIECRQGWAHDQPEAHAVDCLAALDKREGKGGGE